MENSRQVNEGTGRRVIARIANHINHLNQINHSSDSRGEKFFARTIKNELTINNTPSLRGGTTKQSRISARILDCFATLAMTTKERLTTTRSIVRDWLRRAPLRSGCFGTSLAMTAAGEDKKNNCQLNCLSLSPFLIFNF
jgi:hypothetical protein